MIFNVQTHNIIQNIKKELQNVKKRKEIYWYFLEFIPIVIVLLCYRGHGIKYKRRLEHKMQ